MANRTFKIKQLKKRWKRPPKKFPYRRWTKEEDEYLISHAGIWDYPELSYNLNRSEETIQQRLAKLGYTKEDLIDGIPTKELADILERRVSTIGDWVRDKGFPATKISRKYYFKIEDFWEWAEDNKYLIDFSKIPYNYFPPEPKWVKQERNKINNTKKYWTPEEEETLSYLCSTGKVDMDYLVKYFNRTPASIKFKISSLDIKTNYKDNNLKKYSKEDEKYIMDRYNEGYSIERIAKIMRRKPRAIQVKIERLRAKENKKNV